MTCYMHNNIEPWVALAAKRSNPLEPFSTRVQGPWCWGQPPGFCGEAALVGSDHVPSPFEPQRGNNSTSNRPPFNVSQQRPIGPLLLFLAHPKTPYGHGVERGTDMESTGSTGHAQNSGHKVRRPRAARACNLCRLKKNKCDELYPCTYCRSKLISRACDCGSAGD